MATTDANKLVFLAASDILEVNSVVWKSYSRKTGNVIRRIIVHKELVSEIVIKEQDCYMGDRNRKFTIGLLVVADFNIKVSTKIALFLEAFFALHHPCITYLTAVFHETVLSYKFLSVYCEAFIFTIEITRTKNHWSLRH